jgi:bleomycin hydrolase
MKKIDQEMLSYFEKEAQKDDGLQTKYAAASGADLWDLSFDPQAAARLNGAFNVEVKTRGITAQEKSGRCWEFSALNGLRETVAERFHMKSFEFSQNYLSFFDKLEKCNNWLNMVIEHAEDSLDTQVMRYLMEGISDGNVWDQPVGLIQKYGLVPKDVMPETYASNHTASLNRVLNRLLKKDALVLREAEEEKRMDLKKEMLAKIYHIECIFFGSPVKTFDWSYQDTAGNYHEERDLTPFSFCEKYIQTDLSVFVHIINEPTEKEPYYRVIRSHDNGNMAENDRRRLNLPMEEFENLVIEQLEDGRPVWIGLDAGAFGRRKEGIWDPQSFRYEPWLEDDLAMDKGDRLTWGVSSPTHNVLLTAVNLDGEGKPERWKIENSWGKEAGQEGMYVLSEAYFRDYVFEAAVDQKYLNEEEKEALAKEPVDLEPWDLEQF